MTIIKTEADIRNEIESNRVFIAQQRQLYKKNQMTREQFRLILTEHQSIINTLKWVLGENDKYD